MRRKFSTIIGGVAGLYGSLPKQKELIEAWVQSKGPIAEESIEEKLDAINEEEAVERVSCGFRSNGEHGLYMRNFRLFGEVDSARVGVIRDTYPFVGFGP